MHPQRHEVYVSPFSARYSSQEMSRLFSAHFKISTFRKLWVSLAKAQKELGLPITHQQVAELEDNSEKIDFDLAYAYEKKFRHDVMAHIHAFGDQCPKAKSIIHLGATSTYVTDNTDLIQMKTGLMLLFSKLIHVLHLLSQFAENEAATPTLGYTHYQPAQPTTIGKRISLWMQDFLLDAQEIQRHIESLPFLGVKGATGAQASFLALFDGDQEKVKKLEKLIAKEFGFSKVLTLSGQTYTRKLDLNILNTLESFAASAHKMATDIRLLSHDGEIFEKKSKTQVGSSAMPFKKNPIYSERICGISRFVISLAENPAYTTATQWLERSLDDSSNKRLAIPEAFLGADSILNLLIHVCSHLEVDREVVSKHLEEKLPLMMMENLMMEAVKTGKDRQKVHEIFRKLSNKPISEIAKKLKLDPKKVSLQALIGRAPDQVLEFINEELSPYLQQHKNKQALSSPIEV